MRNVAFLLVFVIVILVGSVWLQIFLSKKENKWLGLIIPMICFLSSIVITGSIVSYSYITTVKSVEKTMDGAIVSEHVTEGTSIRYGVGEVLSTAIPVFVIFNISTAFNLVIYGVCRESRNKNSELKKMNIQDLE